MLDAREAYRLWAPTYAGETVVSALDDELAQAMSPDPEGRRLLDAGCGVGRRLPSTGTAWGIDASPEMLAAGDALCVAVADVRALPFADAAFDLVWCRLVLGHLADPWPAYGELARVCRTGGLLFVTDFHPDAVAAGHRRTFRDAKGVAREVEHYVHLNHDALAARAGFALAARRDGVVGPSVQHLFCAAGREKEYRACEGLALVSAFLFRRE